MPREKKQGQDSDQEEDWRDVRAVSIYRDRELEECKKARRSLLRRRNGAHVGTKEVFLRLINLWVHGVFSGSFSWGEHLHRRGAVCGGPVAELAVKVVAPAPRRPVSNKGASRTAHSGY